MSGQGALDHVADEERRLEEAARLLGGTASDVAERLRALLDRQKKLERELDGLKAKAASGATSDLAASAVEVAGVKVLAARLEGFDAKALRDALDRLKQQLGERQKKLERELETLKAKQAAGATADLDAAAVEVKGIKILASRLEGFDAKALRDAMDRLKQQLGDAVIVLAGTQDGKAALVAGVNGSATGKVKAGELLSHIASQIGGKGGGRPDLAQGGGEDGPALASALAAVVDWVTPRI